MVNIETFYLIDYENVHGDGLSGCQDLGKTDHIVIFFTQNAKNIDMCDISNHGSAELDMIEVPAGKQSADMHIGSYIGYLAGKSGKNCKVVIVSKDTDFDNVINFLKQKTEIVASRTEQIKKKSVPKQQQNNQQSANKLGVKVSGTKKTKANNNTKKLKQESTQKNTKPTKSKKELQMQSFFGQNFKEKKYKDKKEQIIDAFMTSKTRTQLNNKLTKIFQGSDVKVILKRLQPKIKDWPGK